MRYAFFGTPRFAAIILKKLIEAGIAPSVLVSNPDRPVGRKKVITPPPTKRAVLDKGTEIRVFQPETKEDLVKISDEIFRDADFGVVAAYAQIIPKEVIDKAKLGIIGVHPSLLPKLRGASPIQTAILEGAERTGVNLFMLDELVDHGPVIASDEMQVTSDMNYTLLEEKLAETGARLLIETLPKFVLGKIKAEEQDESHATYTKKFVTKDGYVDFEELKSAQESGEKAEEILRKIRALNPEPGVYTVVDGRRMKLLAAEISEGKLVLKEIQKEGRKPVRL